jgi:photosystem II stability/assembly factor-like uncharacterized protein
MLFTLFGGAFRENVLKAADYSPQDFVGYWINDDTTTGGITKIFIKIVGEDFNVQAFGKCHPTDCDWGISTTKTSDASDGMLELSWVFSFFTEKLTIKLIDKNHAEIDYKTHFTDNSGRQDYEIKESCTKPNVGDFDKALLSLFKGTKKLTFTGAPGVITVTGQAFPLLISSNDSAPANQIAIAGSKYGKGFVLGFCHDSFFSDSNFDYFDNKTFASNILSYAMKKKILISVSHGEYFNKSNANRFANFANNSGFDVQFLNSEITGEILQNTGVLISGSAWIDFKDSEILAVKDFVNNGGIFLLAGLGWSWLQYHPDKTLEDLPANKLGKEFGIKWVDGVITESKDFIYNDSTVFTILYPESLFAMKRTSQWIEINKGLYGGDISSLVIDPTNAQIIYVGIDGGGVFKSMDGGLTWTQMNTGLTDMDVQSLAIDPTNTQVIYAGTWGSGVFKSLDGGSSWVKINSGLTSLIENYFVIYSLAIDPKNTQTIYAGSNGVFKSTDGGLTWSKVSRGLNIDVWYLIIDPVNTNIIYTYISAMQNGAVLKSTNGGATWTSMNTGLTNTKVISFVIDPTNTQIIYAGTNGGGVFKSTDGGSKWAPISSGLTNTTVRALVIDPTNTQVIYAGTEDGSIFKSVDGGSSWSQINKGFTNSHINFLAIDPTNSQTIYAGTHGDGLFKSTDSGQNWNMVNQGIIVPYVSSLVIDPTNSQTIYAGTWRAGVFKSTNSGLSWLRISNGLQNTDIQCLAIDPQNTQTIYAGAWSGVFKSMDGGLTWTQMNTGLTDMDVQSLAIDPKNTQIIYTGTKSGVFKSANGGANWTSVNTGVTNLNIQTLTIDLTNTKVIYAGSNGVFKSANGGANWTSVNTGLTNENIHSLTIDPINVQVIYAGTGDGVFKSTDGGSNWTHMNSGLKYTDVTSLAIDPKNTQTIYAGTWGNGVFKSTNGGTSWTQINNQLSDTFINCLAIDPTNTQVIYAGTRYNGVIKYVLQSNFNIITTVSLGGSIIPLGTIMVNYWESKDFTITPNTGYKISEVKVDGISVGAVSTYTFSNIISDHTIEATFEPITYTINTSLGLGGSISPSGTITVNSGDSKTFTIIPNSGYKVSVVKVDGVSKGPISSYAFTNITSDHTISAAFEKEITQTVIILQIGSTTFTVNGVSNTLDSPPVIKNNRTLLPIRAVIESLGGTVSWDATERKVTVTLGNTTIELWIGKSIAKVNGVNTPIDSTNPKVVPEIINSRTMLPLRFVTENLGCDVQWDGTTKTITITYQP